MTIDTSIVDLSSIVRSHPRSFFSFGAHYCPRFDDYSSAPCRLQDHYWRHIVNVQFQDKKENSFLLPRTGAVKPLLRHGPLQIVIISSSPKSKTAPPHPPRSEPQRPPITTPIYPTIVLSPHRPGPPAEISVALVGRKVSALVRRSAAARGGGAGRRRQAAAQIELRRSCPQRCARFCERRCAYSPLHRSPSDRSPPSPGPTAEPHVRR